MPVHQFIHDGHIVLERGLRNYWGYNSIGYFAPHNEYGVDPSRPEDVVPEFKHLVKALHDAGIEVIIDVVYNHTGEGNHLGPDAVLPGARQRGVLPPRPGRSPQYYVDYTGCGNSLNMRHPRVLQLIMDSLRYWVTEMHVDGFRFDLASDARAGAARRRPPQRVLRPHPAGPGHQPDQAHRRAVGRRRGRVPGRQLPAALERVERRTATASATSGAASRARWGVREPFHRLGRPVRGVTGRRPYASINFVTAHDGFTLRDLVSYNEKHNEANGEDNRDGETTTARGTAAPRARPTTPMCSRCARDSSATSWRRCCSARACR